MFDVVKSDIRRVISGEQSTKVKLGRILFHPGLHAVLLYRLSRWLHVHHMEPIALAIHYFAFVLTGAQISRRAEVGPGLEIHHPQGTVVTGTAVIGSHCSLVHSNVVGQLYGSDDGPTIGNNFTAGAGAKILGRIRIGNNVMIGANSVVVRSLPDDVTALGIPARVLFSGTTDGGEDKSAGFSPAAVLQRLRPLLETTLDRGTGVSSIDESTGLVGEGLGLDSIEMLRLISAIEEEFDLTIDESEVAVSHFKTVRSLVAFIRECRRS